MQVSTYVKTAALEADEFPDFDESDLDADEDIQLDQKTNGKSIVKGEQTKSTAGKPKVCQANAPASEAKPKIEELKKADKQKPNKDDDEDDDGEEFEEDESDDDEVCAVAVKYVIFLFDKQDEAPVKMAEPPNKRPAGSALKTPVSEKKAKLISPGKGESQKKGGAAKKDGDSATPLPAKQSGKTPAKNDKSN
ncbi:Histone deacetylase [Musa troglodytarum]|uniref:Histone deacetylase n=1 Tax=Musa troglodytarum TaxID=320322 RepID=A0A9E7IFL5_9LILI|nr:Histone deacetylase [Musa troglodytarum]